uniref:TOG domain-containing protein n=1 Tax=Mesocestoides corti TaxID=53468 RepID=A0A5K3FWT2_MESCO
MIAFAKCLPECFTHNLCSPSPPHIKAAVTDNDSTIQETDQKEGVAKISSTNTMGKSAGGNLNKSQKKKKKKAALEASSNMAMGCIGLSMNEGLADPANWPPLTLFANTQLRLFVSRCDPSVEVAIDAESLWLRLGLRACCELEEELESDNDRTSDRRLVLLSQPHNPSALQPTALATRLLLESIRTPVDIQMATASALQRCVNGKSQEEIQHVLDYWLEIYRCLMEKPQSKTDMYGKPVTPSPSKYTSQRIGLARALAAIVGCSRSPGYYPNLRLDNGDVTISSAAPTTAVIDGASIKQQKAGAWLQKIFRFLVDEGLHDPDEEVRYALLQAGLAATREYGVTNLQQMLQVLEAFLNKAPNVAELDMVRQSVVVLLGSLAKYLGPDDPRVGSIFSRLLSAVSFPADVVQKAVEDCLSPLAPKLPPDQLEKTFPRLLSTLFSSMGYAERRGAAYALAGIVRGCGVTTLKQHNIIDKLLNALESKNSKHKE